MKFACIPLQIQRSKVGKFKIWVTFNFIYILPFAQIRKYCHILCLVMKYNFAQLSPCIHKLLQSLVSYINLVDLMYRTKGEAALISVLLWKKTPEIPNCAETLQLSKWEIKHLFFDSCWNLIMILLLNKL